MLVNYKNLPDTSKIYIYPSNRKFYSNESTLIDEKLNSFLLEFIKHELCLHIKYDRFIIIFVSDRTPLSLEENDRLNSFIFAMEKEFNISLVDKINVCFKQGEYVQMKEIPEFKKLVKNKGVSKKTIVFNNLINSKEEFECCWETPAGESQISHLF